MVQSGNYFYMCIILFFYIIIYFNCIVTGVNILFIDDYDIAQEKANMAKTTSDLSTNESSYETHKEYNGIKLKQKRKVCQPVVKTKKISWSPASIDIFGKIIFKLIA